jgi:hypothetical protein
MRDISEPSPIVSVFILTAVFVLMTLLVIYSSLAGYDKGRHGVWKEAVEKGYAQEVQTSEGKAFQWK